MTKAEINAAREALRSMDAETITTLAEDVKTLRDNAKAATCETSAYGLMLNKIRAHSEAMLKAIEAGPDA